MANDKFHLSKFYMLALLITEFGAYVVFSFTSLLLTMTESFRQYIKIRTFLGYRPKEILLELQNAFGDEAPNYACIQRWSKRFRDAVDSPLGSQSNFETQENQLNQQLDDNNIIIEGNSSNIMQKQINANAKQSETAQSTSRTIKSKRSRTTRSKTQRCINE